MAGSFFLPKGTTGRKKNIMILHIQGLILMAVLIVALMGAFGILARNLFVNLILDTPAAGSTMDSFGNPISGILGGNAGSYGGFQTERLGAVMHHFIRMIYTIYGVVSYVLTFAALGGAIFLLILMRKRIKMILEDPVTYENTLHIKKAKYVWLGFLLGGYGAHLFSVNRRKAWIFLGLGIAGMFVPVLFLYTSGISFSDAFLACFIKKDWEGCIDLEEYPYWL